MTYYRVAFCEKSASIVVGQNERWRWRSTLLTSPHALFTLLRIYRSVPCDQIRVFFTASEDEMEGMLLRQNSGELSASLTVEQFLVDKEINQQDIRRLELELHDGPGYDEPYVYSGPTTCKELCSWLALRRKVVERQLVTQ